MIAMINLVTGLSVSDAASTVTLRSIAAKVTTLLA
jgi:hypothetical protein